MASELSDEEKLLNVIAIWLGDCKIVGSSYHIHNY